MGDAGSTWSFRGVIEGFYGPPWTWAARAAVMRFAAARGMTDYLYAPKDDPRHRDRWRELYPPAMLAGFEGLVAEGTLRVGFALSPGLSMDYDDRGDRAALAAKIDQLTGLGIGLICLAVDDIAIRPGLGEEHAALTAWLHDHLAGRADLVLVPTEYTGTTSTPYLDALAAGVPDDVPIGWTGTHVVNDIITRAEAEARAAALGGRPPFVWDNYPVNDGTMADQLFLGPLRGRDPALGLVCSGYAANPMVQATASLPALGSIAAYLDGEDPLTGWAATVDQLGVRVLAEACDGVAVHALVSAVIEADHPTPEVPVTGAIVADDGATSDQGSVWVEPVRALDTWLRAAARVDRDSLGGEVSPWVDQVRDDANLGRVAVRLLQDLRPVVQVDDQGRGVVVGPDNEGAVEQAFAAGVLWAAVRRAPFTVMGPRFAMRPVLAQWPNGQWRFRSASITEDANAIDRLLRHAFEVLDQFDNATEIRVTVDDEPVALEPLADRRWAFEARPGSVVRAAVGQATTTVTAPCDPALADRRLAGLAAP